MINEYLQQFNTFGFLEWSIIIIGIIHFIYTLFLLSNTLLFHILKKENKFFNPKLHTYWKILTIILMILVCLYLILIYPKVINEYHQLVEIEEYKYYCQAPNYWINLNLTKCLELNIIPNETLINWFQGLPQTINFSFSP